MEYLNVFFFGSLIMKGEGADGSRNLTLSQPMPLIEVLCLLGIQPEEVTLAMVNHKSVSREWMVQPGDRLSLFSREYPIFVDWLDHRLNVSKGQS